MQHGAYDRDKFVSRVQAIKGPVHVGAVLSIWPETYCHTLTELWAAGLPVVGVDLGAVGERIRESGAGWLVTRPDVNDIVEVFQSIIDNPQSISERNTAVAQWQNTIGKEYNTARMASCYMPIYDGILQPKSEEAARLAVSR